ncbi:hypothetical protein KSP40_PGU009161 [Platanthera guangdongensis]|uniref:Uncharacterized protein n=1 Tax=Platanthera guangdongensis TaxID=2320717 RepID=A0ABR2MDZ4_9ASPA
MLFPRANASHLLLPLLTICVVVLVISSHASSLKTYRSGEGRAYGFMAFRRLSVEVSSNLTSNSSFALAAKRTERRDPLNNFEDYTGGWNISNRHYWASVGFSSAPLFGIAFVCIGCALLYNGQGKFHSSTSNTLDYVVGQANFTVQNLRDFTGNLSEAKRIKVATLLVPADLQGKIDEIVTKVNTSANDLDQRTADNSKNIRDVLETVRLILIIVAAVMLLLAFLGFLFSILGLQFIVYILVIIGWFLVAATFILSGVFLVLHNPSNAKPDSGAYASLINQEQNSCGSYRPMTAWSIQTTIDAATIVR